MRSSTSRYGASSFAGQELLRICRGGNRQDLRPDVAGRLRRRGWRRCGSGPSSAGTCCWPCPRPSSGTRTSPAARRGGRTRCRTSGTRPACGHPAPSLPWNFSYSPMRGSQARNACSQASSLANKLPRSQRSASFTCSRRGSDLTLAATFPFDLAFPTLDLLRATVAAHRIDGSFTGHSFLHS